MKDSELSKFQKNMLEAIEAKNFIVAECIMSRRVVFAKMSKRQPKDSNRPRNIDEYVRLTPEEAYILGTVLVAMTATNLKEDFPQSELLEKR